MKTARYLFSLFTLFSVGCFIGGCSAEQAAKWTAEVNTRLDGIAKAAGKTADGMESVSGGLKETGAAVSTIAPQIGAVIGGSGLALGYLAAAVRVLASKYATARKYANNPALDRRGLRLTPPINAPTGGLTIGTQNADSPSLAQAA